MLSALRTAASTGPGGGKGSGEKKNSTEKINSNEKKVGSGLVAKDEGNRVSTNNRASSNRKSIGRRKSPPEPTPLNRSTIRQKASRYPKAKIELQKYPSTSKRNEDIPMGGVILNPLRGIIPVPPEGPAWGYSVGEINNITIDGLPQNSCVVVHPGEQRLFLRHRTKELSGENSIQVLLDVTESEYRSRLVLQDTMEFLFEDGKHQKSVFIRLPLNEHTDTSSPWRKRITTEEFWQHRNRQDEGSSFSSEGQEGRNGESKSTTATATTLPPPSVVGFSEKPASHRAVSSVNGQPDKTKKKSVSWGVSVDLMDGTTSTITSEGDESIMSEVKNEQFNDFSQKSVEMHVDGIRQFAFSEGKACVYVGNHSMPQSVPQTAIQFDDLPTDAPNAFNVDLPSAPSGSCCAAFMLETSGSHLLVPRKAKRTSTKVYLVIPHDVVFPLQANDLIVVRRGNQTADQQLFSFRVAIPKISRSIPTDNQELNAAHSFGDVGLEVFFQQRKQRWNGSVDAYTNTECFAKLFTQKILSNKKELTIGRGGTCDICVPDPHLSRHHCTLKHLQGTAYYTLEPADDKKAMYLLCGKTDSHSRPPIALRTGDSISIGRSEFKVVFQQRGNRDLNDINLKTAKDELRQRLNTLKQMFELDVKKDVSTNEQNGQTQPTSTDRTNSLKEMNAGDDELESDLVDRFARLNPTANESSATFQQKLRRNSSSSGVYVADEVAHDASDRSIPGSAEQQNMPPAQVPLFKDINSLLETFENRTFGKEPIMILMAVRGPSTRGFFLCSPLETTIGSSIHANISIANDKRMSPFHSRIFFDVNMQRWVLEDLSSKHGTFLRVDEPLMVCTGDVVVAGLTLIRVMGNPPLPSVVSNQPSGARLMLNNLFGI